MSLSSVFTSDPCPAHPQKQVSASQKKRKRKKCQSLRQTDSLKCLIVTKLGLPAVCSAPPRGTSPTPEPRELLEQHRRSVCTHGLCRRVSYSGALCSVAGSSKSHADSVEGMSKVLRQTLARVSLPHVCEDLKFKKMLFKLKKEKRVCFKLTVSNLLS